MDEQKVNAVLNAASAMADADCAWWRFFEAIFGVHGSIRQQFGVIRSPDGLPFELWHFEPSDHCQDLLRMMARLRERRAIKDYRDRVITVRLPPAVHGALVLEAREHGCSLNGLCLSKLLRGVPYRQVPFGRFHALGKEA